MWTFHFDNCSKITGKKVQTWTQSEESNKKRSIAHKCKPTIVCPHCNKNGKGSAMQQWHFNNCKQYKLVA